MCVREVPPFPLPPLVPLSLSGMLQNPDVFLHRKIMVIPQIYYIYGLNPFKVAGSATGHTKYPCLHASKCILVECGPV